MSATLDDVVMELRALRRVLVTIHQPELRAESERRQTFLQNLYASFWSEIIRREKIHGECPKRVREWFQWKGWNWAYNKLWLYGALTESSAESMSSYPGSPLSVTVWDAERWRPRLSDHLPKTKRSKVYKEYKAWMKRRVKR